MADITSESVADMRSECLADLLRNTQPGQVEATNNACERDLRPSVIQRKVTNGYRAMWAAEGEADIRSVVDTARLKPGTSVFNTILQTVTA